MVVVAVLTTVVVTERRAQARIRLAVLASIPPPPSLSGWPPAYASRVLAATAHARRVRNPEPDLEKLARLYHANNCYAEAETAEKGLARVEPKRALWTWLLADDCQNLGDEDDARRYLERTVALDPSYAPAHLKLADLYLKRDALGKAQLHYRERLGLVPGDPYARLGLARIAQAEGYVAEARRELESLVRDHPDFYSAHNLLAELCALAGNQSEAARERAAALGTFTPPEDPWLTRLYAWSFDPFHRAEARLPPLSNSPPPP